MFEAAKHGIKLDKPKDNSPLQFFLFYDCPAKTPSRRFRLSYYTLTILLFPK
jgi:hypothetical protein